MSFDAGMIVYLTKEGKQHEPIYSNNSIPLYWGMFFFASDLICYEGKESVFFELSQVNIEHQMDVYRLKIEEEKMLNEYKMFLEWLHTILTDYNCVVLIRNLKTLVYVQDRGNEEDFKIDPLSMTELFFNVIAFDYEYLHPTLQVEIEDYDSYIFRYGIVPVELQQQKYLQYTKRKNIELNKQKVKLLSSQIVDECFKMLIPTFLLVLIIPLFVSVLKKPEELKILRGGIDTVKAIFAYIFFGGIGFGACYANYHLIKTIRMLTKKKMEIKRLIIKFEEL